MTKNKSFIYVDNYRGFQDCIVPLSDVNFLVGENSTGKSTILEVVNLLSSYRFWIHQEFNTEEKYLGSFENIVSDNSQQRDSFRIGWAQGSSGSTKGVDDYILCMEFRGYKERPVIRHLIYSEEDLQVRFKITDNEIRYKTTRSIDVESKRNKREYLRFFSRWSGSKVGFKRDYERVRITDRPPISTLPILDYIVSQKKRKDRGTSYGVMNNFIPYYERSFWWMAPVRSKPERIYDIGERTFSPEGSHTPFLMRDILNDDDQRERFKDYLRRFGEESGLFADIDVESFGEIKRYTSPFKLAVSLGRGELGINDVGYGVAQILPVVVELFYRKERSWFAIQQPEVHLHPKARAALGDLFFERTKKDNKTLLVETHSDYIIDRFRYNVNNSSFDFSTQILFFDREDGFNKIYPLQIDSHGSLPDEMPDNYRQFFVQERLKTLSI